MANQGKIRSDIKAFLPGAEEPLVESLIAKVEAELSDPCGFGKPKRRSRKAVVERVIMSEERSALGLL